MYFDLGLISKYKKELMGFSAIGIILCHAPATLYDLPSFAEKIMSLGQICVPIFFLLSGMGIFYSLDKNDNLIQWYKKRFIRLFIPYLILTIPYYIWFGYVNEDSILTTILNISTINYWINRRGLWFVCIIIPCYIIAPFIYKLYLKNKNLTLFIFIFIFIISFFLGDYKGAVIQASFFFLGMYLTPFIQKNKKINWLLTSSLAILLYVICVKVSMLSFLPRLFFLLPLSILIPIFFIDKIYYVKTFSFIGKISLESYLTNCFFGVILMQYGHFIIPEKLSTGNYIQYLLVVILGITVSYFTHKLSNIILNKCTKTSLNA